MRTADDLPPLSVYEGEPKLESILNWEKIARDKNLEAIDWAGRCQILEEKTDRLRERNRAQRQELRRLNTSIIDKLHRLQLAQARLERLEQALEGAGIRVTFEF